MVAFSIFILKLGPLKMYEEILKILMISGDYGKVFFCSCTAGERCMKFTRNFKG